MSLARLDVGLARKASAALEQIRQDGGGTAPAEVITRLKGLPALMRTSGLPATMAFLYAKAGDDGALERAYRTVRDALVTELAAVWGWDDRPGALEFFDRIGDPAKIDGGDLALASARLEEFASWMRRLAEALDRTTPSRRGDAAAGRAGPGRWR